MSSIVVLDARPLSQIAHPRKHVEISEWFLDVAASGRRIVLPEIIDYEVRRGLLRIPAPRQVEELDDLKDGLYYDPLTTELMLQAAQVWADARNMGRPFTSDDRLDSLSSPCGSDAILVAQAQGMGDRRCERAVGLLCWVKALRPERSSLRRQRLQPAADAVLPGDNGKLCHACAVTFAFRPACIQKIRAAGALESVDCHERSRRILAGAKQCLCAANSLFGGVKKSGLSSHAPPSLRCAP